MLRVLSSCYCCCCYYVRNVISGLFWGYFGVILGLFWEYFGVILGLLWCYCACMHVCMCTCEHVFMYSCIHVCIQISRKIFQQKKIPKKMFKTNFPEEKKFLKKKPEKNVPEQIFRLEKCRLKGGTFSSGQ